MKLSEAFIAYVENKITLEQYLNCYPIENKNSIHVPEKNYQYKFESRFSPLPIENPTPVKFQSIKELNFKELLEAVA